MPTYAQLASEPVWGAQFVSPVMNAGLLGPLRTYYNLGPTSVGAAGDNNHLYGRHRSYDWDKLSRYCTNRAYGTTDSRDQGGNRDWYRAVDVGITGQLLFDASRRMDALARSGACPGLAEWFGTFDGNTVVGWFEGRPSTSDSSHLYHLHVGLWNQYAGDAQTMTLIYNTIVGNVEPTPSEVDMAAVMIQDSTGIAILWTGATEMIFQNVVSIDMVGAWNQAGVPGPFAVSSIGNYGIPAYTPSSGGGGGGGGATPAQVAAAVRTELDKTKLPAVPGQLEEI